MKTCTRCKRELPREAFSKDRYTPDGLQRHCRECQREETQDRPKPYDADELLSRPFEHRLEALFDKAQRNIKLRDFERISGIPKATMANYRDNPWLYCEDERFDPDTIDHFLILTIQQAWQ